MTTRRPIGVADDAEPLFTLPGTAVEVLRAYLAIPPPGAHAPNPFPLPMRTAIIDSMRYGDTQNPECMICPPYTWDRVSPITGVSLADAAHMTFELWTESRRIFGMDAP